MIDFLRDLDRNERSRGFLCLAAVCFLAGSIFAPAAFAQSNYGQSLTQPASEKADGYHAPDEAVLARPGDRVTLLNEQTAANGAASGSPFRSEPGSSFRNPTDQPVRGNSPFRSAQEVPGEEDQTRKSLPVATVVSSLAIVLGLFGALVWVWRRGGGAALGGLSKEAFQVIGRSPLAPRQNMVLVRCGRRILVLAVSGTTTSTLAEITDPDEVAELLALTGGGVGHHQFQQTLAELGKERPPQKRFVDEEEEDRPRHLFASV